MEDKSVQCITFDAYPSRRFRCAWFGLILHGADGLFFLVLMLGLVLGLT